MATNPYFNSNFGIEAQELIEDLIIESIQQMGIDLFYLPRENVNKDLLFGEDKISKFHKAYKVEFYVNSIDNFGGESDILTKFGLEIHDELNLVVSVRRFMEAVAVPFDQLSYMTRPREGDIVFFPFDPGIFEVSFVEDKPYYFQAGKIHTYELKLKKLESAGENIRTGIEEIDEVNEWTSTLALVLVTGTGNYLTGERVYQGASLIASTASAEVVTWDAAAKRLVLTRVKSTFLPAANVVGELSTANWTFPVSNDTTFIPNENKHNNGIVDNERIKDEFGDIVDDTEQNPLSS